ncbi:MAG: outer membrane protein assembly factor BamD [Ahrensia sp.]|nr:outer membrane protein assembly factor BamD [Ahrensia sp.]
MKSTVCAFFALTLPFTATVMAQPPVPPANVSVFQLAQADASFEVQQLQEEVRRLNGKVEELNFLLIQLQEKLRRMEEDNEIRFQEIEEKQSGTVGSRDVDVAANDGGNDRLEKPERAETAPEPQTSQQTVSQSTSQPAPTAPAKQRNLAPRALGTLTFDANGNVVDARPDDVQNAGLSDPAAGDEALNASEFGATPDEVFKAGLNALDSRDYPTARRAFSAHRAAWPNDPQSGEVLHNLGLAHFWQKEYYEAANAHLEAHKEHPGAPTAPDNLLGLGLALAGLNQREVACATYAEVLKQYPQAQPRLGERIKDEQASAKC